MKHPRFFVGLYLPSRTGQICSTSSIYRSWWRNVTKILVKKCCSTGIENKMSLISIKQLQNDAVTNWCMVPLVSHLRAVTDRCKVCTWSAHAAVKVYLLRRVPLMQSWDWVFWHLHTFPSYCSNAPNNYWYLNSWCWVLKQKCQPWQCSFSHLFSCLRIILYKLDWLL